MNASFFAGQLLAYALVLSALAAVAEITATRQVAFETYRFVPLIRLMRKGHKAAAVLVTLFAAIAVYTTPALSLPVFAMSLTVGALIQLRAMVSGYWNEVVLYGVMPVTAILLTLANLGTSVLPHPAGLQLGAPALAVAVLLAAQCFVIRHYRNHRELLLILQG
jgi:hypothetical protein